ncbi:MAG: hypothetical protein CVU35_02335 [Betaproteobacteria bacterium HGW-Betaproteobacteria-8]|nr:MAG: hypothetical protein CVU35_02335 [Betaproteobacteria bacterium HGW-Betaproteobacteria-8]
MHSDHTLKIEDAVIGEDVIVIKPDSFMYNKIGQIWKVVVRGDRVRVSVCFEGEIYNFNLEGLSLA